MENIDNASLKILKHKLLGLILGLILILLIIFICNIVYKEADEQPTIGMSDESSIWESSAGEAILEEYEEVASENDTITLENYINTGNNSGIYSVDIIYNQDNNSYNLSINKDITYLYRDTPEDNNSYKRIYYILLNNGSYTLKVNDDTNLQYSIKLYNDVWSQYTTDMKLLADCRLSYKDIDCNTFEYVYIPEYTNTLTVGKEGTTFNVNEIQLLELDGVNANMTLTLNN